MKKFKNVFICGLIFASVLLLSGCSLLKLSREKFRKVLEEEYYEIVDASDMVSDSSFVESYDAAISNDHNIEFHFYIYKDTKYAKDVFSQNKRNMVETKKYSGAESNAINWINYSSYTLRTNDSYERIIYKYNTMLRIKSTSEKTSVAEAMIKKLGF